jgi:hypothetical protein
MRVLELHCLDSIKGGVGLLIATAVGHPVRRTNALLTLLVAQGRYLVDVQSWSRRKARGGGEVVGENK